MPPVEHEVHPAELVTDDLETPSLDDRTYRVIRLPNQLEALLVHDPQTDRASAAMDVNVGNFSDEPHMPGMAHAVEHLLFMGTKKYPEENAYNQYLSAHSGSSNAYTGSTSTNYFFDLAADPTDGDKATASNPSPLKGALDRFSQFFIEPLFLESTLDRELRAVDSENKKNLQSDLWRLNQLEKSLSNPAHPYCHFGTGNLEVLKTQPEAQGINVRQKFIEFYQKHYSANRMKLVILGSESLDVLESWAVEYFSAIENKNLQPNRWEAAPPLGPEQLGTQVFAKPVMDSRDLGLSFPFLDEDMLYESLPGRYISHLIGHEGPGSIMSYVKSKGWVNGLSAGAYSVCPGSPGMFDCQIRLTEEGLINYQEIVKVFFQYVSLLRETPPRQWVWEEQKGMADVDFKFKQKTPASRFTSKLSAVMQKPLPREWLLSGTSKLRKFDPLAIREGIDCLRPDNLRMTIVSRDFPGKWEKKEKWYGTEYTCERIPTDFMKELEEAFASTAVNRIPSLSLPHRNQFIPTKLEVEKKDISKPAVAPKLIRNDDFARIWYKKDDKFWVPKATLLLSCRSPVIFVSAENAVKARIFTDLVQDALEEYSYDAELAGLDYHVSVDHRGLSLSVSGYNDKLSVLLDQVLKTMKELEIKQSRFDIIKERVSRAYQNWAYQQPFHQVGEYTNWLIVDHDFTIEDFAASLPNITFESAQAFRKDILSQLHVEAVVHGNLYKEDALKLTDMLQKTLKTRPLPKPQWPILRSLLLPEGCNYVYKKTLADPANVNHCIEYFLFVGEYEIALRAKGLLLDQILHEPAFDQLRTKEQLGYIVFSGLRTTSTTLGFRFLIQSEKTAQCLEARIDSFLANYVDTLAEMCEKEFESHKRSLINKQLEKKKNLDQETNRLWGQIASEYCDFERPTRTAEIVQNLTKDDIIAFFNRYISPSSPKRAKLSVWLVAQAASDICTKEISHLVETLKLNSTDRKAKAATDLQAKLSAAGQNEAKEVEELKEYLLHELKVAEDRIGAAVELWHRLPRKNGVVARTPEDHNPPVLNGREIEFVEDIWDFKARLPMSVGARPVKDLSEYEESEAKL